MRVKSVCFFLHCTKCAHSWRNTHIGLYLPLGLFFVFGNIFLPDEVQWANLINSFCNITFQYQFRLVLSTLNFSATLLSKEWFHILDTAMNSERYENHIIKRIKCWPVSTEISCLSAITVIIIIRLSLSTYCVVSIREGRTQALCAWGELSPRSWSHAAVGLGPVAALDCRCCVLQQLLLQKLGGVVAFIWVLSEKELRSTKHYFSQFFHKPKQDTGTNSSCALVKKTCWGCNVIFDIRERRDLPMKLQLVMQKVRFEHDRRGHGRNNWGWQVTMYAGTLPCWLGCCSLILCTTCGADGTQNSPGNAVCWWKYG